MVCKVCGADNNDTAKFCRTCGTALAEENNVEETQVQPVEQPEPVSPAPKKKVSKPPKFLLPAIGAAVVVVLLIILIPALFGGSSSAGGAYIFSENSIICKFIPDDEESIILFNGKKLDDTIDNNAYITSANLKNDVAAVLNYDNVLYIVTKNGVEEVAEDIERAIISNDGNVMAYLDEDYTLYTYDVKAKKSNEVADDVEYFAFSPDGKTLAYAVVDGDDYEGYIKVGSKKETQLKNFVPLSVSNNSKIIYGAGLKGDDQVLAVYNIKNESYEKLATEPNNYFFNNDATELIFSYDSKYYISVDGKEKVKLGNYEGLAPIYPNKAAAVTTFIGTLMIYEDDDGEYGIGYIDKKLEMQEVIKNIDYSDVYLTEDGNTVYYYKNDKLYCASKKNKFEEPTKIASDVYDYVVSPDGKKVYYINDDDELICYSKGKETDIADDVSTLRMTDNGTLFFLADYEDDAGDLYLCTNGKDKVKVESDVYSISVSYDYLIFYADYVSDGYSYYGTADMYFGTNKKNFEKVAEGVRC